MKPKTIDASKVEANIWKNVPDFNSPEFQKLVKSERDKWFQKALNQRKKNEKAVMDKHNLFKQTLKAVREDPSKIKEVVQNAPEIVEEIVEVLGKDFFKTTDGDKETAIEFAIPKSQQKSEDEIIAEYEKRRQAEGKDAFISNLLAKIDSQLDYDDDDERNSFHEELKWLVQWIESEEKIEKIISYAYKDKTKETLKTQVIENQKALGTSASKDDDTVNADESKQIADFLSIHWI